MTTEYDTATGRPLSDGAEAVQTLPDDELQAEVTVALLDVERRERRLDRLEEELQRRRRELIPNGR